MGKIFKKFYDVRTVNLPVADLGSKVNSRDILSCEGSENKSACIDTDKQCKDTEQTHESMETEHSTVKKSKQKTDYDLIGKKEENNNLTPVRNNNNTKKVVINMKEHQVSEINVYHISKNIKAYTMI
jgi:hypothetical protein